MQAKPTTKEEYIAWRIASSRIMRRLLRHLANDQRLRQLADAKRVSAKEWTVDEVLAREG